MRGAQIFELFPIFSNYIQRIFSGGSKNFLGGFRPPWLRAWAPTISGVYGMSGMARAMDAFLMGVQKLLGKNQNL